MYNGIGLTTPRGSGTNGYVQRNLSTLRSFQSSQDRQSVWEAAPPKHREPDSAILEHERKRKVEVKCLELQLELEEKGIDEADIEEQVSALRTKLLAALPQPSSKKPTDTHAMAAAKKVELDKMARAFGTRSDYQEGDAFDREKQDERRLQRAAERDERERRRQEERAQMTAQKAKWEEERKERDRLRRREEDRARREREQGSDRRGDVRDREAMPPPPLPGRRDYRDRERPSRRSASPRRDRGRGRPSSISPSRSPPRRSFVRSGSPEPPSRRNRSPSPLRKRSPSPRRLSSPPTRRRGYSPHRERGGRSDSRSPPPVRHKGSPKHSPTRDSRSPSPPRRPRSARALSPLGRRESPPSADSRSPSRSPPRRRRDSVSPVSPRGRSRSVASTGSSMSVSDRSRSSD